MLKFLLKWLIILGVVGLIVWAAFFRPTIKDSEIHGDQRARNIGNQEININLPEKKPTFFGIGVGPVKIGVTVE